MSKDIFNKIHYEVYKQSSQQLHKYMGLPDVPFYEIIDLLDKELKHKSNVFPFDAACRQYINFVFQQMQKDMKLTDTKEDERARFWDIYMPYMFYKHGKKLFRPTKELIHMLIDTEIKNLDAFFVKSPFKSIYITIPNDVKVMNPFNLPVNGLYIVLYEKEDIDYEGFSEEFQEYKNYEHSKSLIVCAISDIILPPTDPRETMYYWNLALREGDLSNQVNTLLNKYDEDYTSQQYSKCKETYNRTFLENILFFCINFLLYINAKNDFKYVNKEKSSNKKQPKSKSKIKKAQKKSSLPYYEIGTDIVIEHSYKKVINLYDKSATEKRRLTGRWVVRGHWRNQAHGQAFSERKLKWIQPYIKGEDLSEIIDKQYIVK